MARGPYHRAPYIATTSGPRKPWRFQVIACRALMCLVALAHRATERYPFILAANRDEDLTRPTFDSHPWPDAPHVVGGRDAVQHGSWLAATRSRRFAAVTNLRGAVPRSRSRGALVSDFVRTGIDVRAHAAEVAAHANEYSGFHLLAGVMGEEVLYISPETQYELASGVHGVSNAPRGEHWPKVDVAVDAMTHALSLPDADAVVDTLLAFLAAPRGTNAVESEVFIASERYGTRSSTVIVATRNETIFVERIHIPPSRDRHFRMLRHAWPQRRPSSS